MKKLFDPLKAKAQIQVYKEIYNFDNSEDDEDKDGALRILKSANQDDKESIKQYFESQNKGTKSQIEEEMERLQNEIDSLEDVTSGH